MTRPTDAEIDRAIQRAWTELDPAQLAVLGRLSPAQRWQLMADLSDFGRSAIVALEHLQSPHLDEDEIMRRVTQHMLDNDDVVEWARDIADNYFRKALLAKFADVQSR